ncbi:MFS transporter [Bacillus infantis]|uniref:MFS transporter n=1 Tax=Bacillus infantis TaxID=324767 RepID=UPI001CD73E33|nr:MFS transporter [Bacillus infantis]MCA1033498.1 MFS transporter [Bacillus infantis]
MKLLRNYNFTILFLGRMVTNIGDSLYTIAAMWLVYELGGSTFYTGLAGFLTMLPRLFQFLTGPIVDRYPLKKILVITQVIQLILILTILVIYTAGFLSVFILLIIMPIITSVNQFVYPAQTASLPRIVEKKQLVQANSMFSFAYQGIDIVSTSLGGILIALFGVITLYIIDSVTFTIALLLFLSLKIPHEDKFEKDAESNTEKHTRVSSIKFHLKQYTSSLKEGYNFVKGSIISKFFYGSIAANFSFGIALAVLPAYSSDRGGPELYGYFLAAFSAGFLIGAFLSNFLKILPFGKTVVFSFLLSALLWISSVIVPSSMLSIIIFALALIPLGAAEVTMAAVGQQIIPQQFLARTFSLISSISASAMPLGSLLGGYLGTIMNPYITFIIGSLGMLTVSIVWLVIPQLRRIPKVDEIKAEDYISIKKELA